VRRLEFRGACRRGEQRVAMRLEVYQRVAHRRDDGARRDRGAGELVEHAVVPAHGPALARRLAERAAVEVQDPVVAIDLDLVAETGRLAMRYHAHAADRAVGEDADEQADRAAVAAGRDRVHDHRDRPVAQPRAIHGHRRARPEQRRVRDADGVLVHRVVIGPRGQHVGEGAQQEGAFVRGDALRGGLPGDGHEQRAEDGEAGEDAGAAQHAAGDFSPHDRRCGGA
jgi:hypothetical protein